MTDDATRDAILQARARRLAIPPVPRGAAVGSRHVLCFDLASRPHAIDLGYAAEVLPLRSVSPIPGAPAVWLGVLYARGRIVPVLDGRRMLGVPEAAPSPASRIIRLAVSGLDLGLLVDGGVRVADVTSDLASATTVASVGRGGFVEAVTRNGLVLLDAVRLAADPRLQPAVTAVDPLGRDGTTSMKTT